MFQAMLHSSELIAASLTVILKRLNQLLEAIHVHVRYAHVKSPSTDIRHDVQQKYSSCKADICRVESFII